MNTMPAQEIKRRGIAAVDDCIAKGDLHVIRNNTSFLSLPAILAAALLLSAVPANATDACEKHLKMTCNNCHTLEAVCERIGNPPKGWKAVLNRMITNGAELSREDVEALAACMSQPSEAAKAACGK